MRPRLIPIACLILGWRSVDGLSSYLAKTTETFKLAELQYAEAHLQAEEKDYTMSRLLLDKATGSTLLELSGIPSDLFDDDSSAGGRNKIPSSIRRCDWVLEIFVCAQGANQLIRNLRASKAQDWFVEDGWVLDYVRFEEGQSQERGQEYSMKTLLCCVAQALPSQPSLDHEDKTDKLLVVDTKTAAGTILYFGRVRLEGASGRDDTVAFELRWPGRPFQYSSAISIKAAKIIIDWLHAQLQLRDAEKAPLLLDPTCGSGTFLGLGICHGWRVEGHDVNSNCIEGSLKNLFFMFGEERVRQVAKLKRSDSSLKKTVNHEDEAQPSCVVSNLPWGMNSIEYHQENSRILSTVRNRIPGEVPCVFVTRSNSVELFQKAGFKVLAQASIPPQNFQLPNSKKAKKQKRIDEQDGDDRNRCVVTFAMSI